MKLAGAPISWGVCEVPGWGLQLGAEQVLAQMSELGMTATEAGPPGFLPADARSARAALDAHGLGLVGGFVTVVLHDPAVVTEQLALVERQAARLASLGAEVLVLAAATGGIGYSATLEIGDAGWTALFRALDLVDQIASRNGLALAVHPHFGTVIERAHHVQRFLEGCRHGLCLDTGHLALGGAQPDAVAAAAGDRVRHVHLKDVDPDLVARVRAGDLDYARAVRSGLYRALGDGDARIHEVLAFLGGRGYGGWLVLEHDVMLDAEPRGIPPWIRRSLAFARTHGG